MPPFSLLDGIAFAVLLACWLGFNRLCGSNRFRRTGFTRAVAVLRHRWMVQAAAREVRIADTNLVGNLMRSVAFFTSTTIFIIAGLIAVLGASDQARLLLSELPWIAQPDKAVWEIKVLLLLVMFTYAFFKLSWTIRQYNYCCIILGNAPDPAEPQFDDLGARAGRLVNLAGDDFNLALRAYYFGLGTLAWFVHPVAFVAASLWVVVVLYRREFHSRTLVALLGEGA